MKQPRSRSSKTPEINASWERCEHTHKLVREVANPILRLQQSEVLPRQEEMTERLGGRRGIVRRLSEIALEAGHSLVVADKDSVIVRLESPDRSPTYEQEVIALGSCWDERLAGTNGVAMARASGKAFTVRGKDHYFSRLQPFACTGVPLLDASNDFIGTLNLTIIDRNNPTDYLFAQQLLDSAALRIQRFLFETQFKDHNIISLPSGRTSDLLSSISMVAVNDAGMIIGSTTHAHLLAGQDHPADIIGKPFDLLFGEHAEKTSVPARILSVDPTQSQIFPTRESHITISPIGAKTVVDQSQISPESFGSKDVDTTKLVNQARIHFERATPFVIEGSSGTGKTALIEALFASSDLEPHQCTVVDCSILYDQDESEDFVRTLLEQARIIERLKGLDEEISTVVFDSIDELPEYGQAHLRGLLEEIERNKVAMTLSNKVSDLRIIATSKTPLLQAVEAGEFRDDLYFRLATATIKLPDLSNRQDIGNLIQKLACQEAGKDVSIAPDALDVLTQYHWPGNIRQLRSVLVQALLEGDGQRILAAFLPELRPTTIAACQTASTGINPIVTPAVDYDEKSVVLSALHRNRWNVSKTARELGMGRATLHRKITRHDLVRPN